MPAPKPGTVPHWATSATGLANTTTPPSGTQDDGWTPNTAPPAEYFNWWQNLLGRWIAYLDDLASQVLTWISLQTFLSGIAFGDGTTQTTAAKMPLVQTGQARHLDAVTFPIAYSSPPVVVITGGLNDEAAAKWGALGTGAETGARLSANVYDVSAPTALSTTGFTVSARLKQKGGGTITAQSIGSPHTIDTGDETTPGVGGTSASNVINPAPSTSDAYTVHYSGTINVQLGTNDPPPNQYGGMSAALELAIEASLDGISWSEVAPRQTHTERLVHVVSFTTGTLNFSGDVGVTVPGMTTAGKFRIRVTAFTVTDGASAGLGDSTADYSVSLPAAAAVTYNASSTPDQFASKTPDTDDRITWTAIGS